MNALTFVRYTVRRGSVILDFQGKHPRIDPTAFVAPNSLIIGDVDLGVDANVWFFCLLRGDVNSIRVGAGCNIQDCCIIHVARDRFPTVLEADVILGHRVTVHGCHISRGALIGIGAMVLNGARVGEESIIGAGAVVTPGTIIPTRTLALGIPAKPVRELREEDFAMMNRTRESYRDLMQVYKGSLLPGKMKKDQESDQN
jgi:carbonic anhydrase/acetyltransferase-like protein (isoleucine patch superfamily)